PTIRSRCRAISLRVPPAGDVAALLTERDGIPHDRAIAAARAAQSHIGMARRLATDDGARERRRQVLEVPSQIRGVGDAVLAAADLVDLARTEAKAATEERDATERSELLHSLGEEGSTRLPPAVRGQLR